LHGRVQQIQQGVFVAGELAVEAVDQKRRKIRLGGGRKDTAHRDQYLNNQSINQWRGQINPINPIQSNQSNQSNQNNQWRGQIIPINPINQSNQPNQPNPIEKQENNGKS
jgi:hypothetical protein